MAVYRTVWEAVWFAVLAVTCCWAGLTLSGSTVAGSFALGVVVALGLGLALECDHAAPGTVARLRRLAGPAAWAGAAVVSASVLSVWRPGTGLVEVFALAVTSPGFVATVRSVRREPVRRSVPRRP